MAGRGAGNRVVLEVGDRPTPDDPGAPLVAAARTWSLLLDGEVEAALERGAALVEDGSPGAAMVWAATLAAGVRGDLARAERLAAAGLAAATAHRAELPYGEAQVGGAYCVALLLAGSLATADTLATAGHRRATELGVPLLVGAWSAIRWLEAKAPGRVHEARAVLHEAVVLLRGQDALRLAGICVAELAGAYAMSGKAGQARA